MPFIENSSYKVPFLFRSKHLNTIIPSTFRKVKGVNYERERIELPDGDFLDLDWSRVGSNKIAIVCHGLEGKSHRVYVRGMVRALNRGGWDAAAVNYRGCSGEPNRLLRSYHSGSTDDLHTIVTHVAESGPLGTPAEGAAMPKVLRNTVGARRADSAEYGKISLIGFSLGGNLILKYLGENVYPIPSSVKIAAVVSTPCDLDSSVDEMDRWRNRIYLRRFLRMLHEKIKDKMHIFPGEINDDDFSSIKTLRQFDDRYAPIHGFKDARDYYEKCSSGQFLSGIKIPTLVINARDDPFLSRECYPVKEAKRSRYLHLEMPKHGGHTGFYLNTRSGDYWHEERIMEFIGTGK